jgi:formate dehydrogenase major subunit
VVVQGSNMAECHPVAFRWVMEAKNRGATIIHVDPRFTRTSAVADLHVPLRPGSDIAFLGGIVRHILENDRWFHEYVVHYTNAATIIDERFQDTEELDGFFSGFDAERNKYAWDTWSYQGVDGVVPAAGHKEVYGEKGAGRHDLRGVKMTEREVDPTLLHPRCVFQLLKKHYARYTPELVEETCGVPKALFLEVAETLCRNSGRERTSAFCYAVGWTQHTVGVQYIRTAAIIQLLLGNMGRPGGGIMALRGHASIQGSTDIPTLFDLLPGYLPMPHAVLPDRGLDQYVNNNASATGWWSEFRKYIVSLQKAWFGDAATADNDWLFDTLPRLTGNHSHMTTVSEMADGKVKGYFVVGENPTVGSMNGALHREGLRRLDWLVVRDFALTETAEFWRTAPELERGEVRTEEIQTEVFFFPAATHTEKDGSFTNTQRMLQWHHRAIEPPGDCRSELHFVYDLGKRLKALYAGSTAERDRPIQALTWDYGALGPHAEPDAERVLREINGYTVADGQPVPGFAKLAADGSTACGCWIYSGCFAGGVNQPARRRPQGEQHWVAPEWGWAWPMNRRLLYNRASADPEGRPWSERKRYVWWDEGQRRWTGHDVPDFIVDRPPSYRAPRGATGIASIGGEDPFIMQADGKGWLFAPSGLLDGPFPTHYEPEESVIENPLYPQQCNPARMEWHRRENPYHRAWGDARFPYVLTTYRLTEHHTAGGMSRWLSWLSELQPEMFCEVSRELAAEQGLANGGWATLTTARGEIECRVLVTARLRPLRVRGKVVHTIGLPYHWSYVGLVRGDPANELIPFVADPNVSIQESKALTGNIRAGRHSFGRRSATGGASLRQPEPAEGEAPRDLPGLHARHRAPPVEPGRR